MHLTLLVPGLLWPREILRDTTFDLPLPALSLLIGRGRRSSLADEDTWLANAFDIDLPLPAAALRLLGDGGWPEDFSWLCLDPVHLRLAERAIVVDDPRRLELTTEEDAALRQALAPLLDWLGEIVAPRPGHWYLRLKTPIVIDTCALPQAIGRPADPALPAGADGPVWRRLLAEVQPLLHGLPLNRTREAAGQPTVNSLWPWGPGRLPAVPSQSGRRRFDKLWTDDAILKGLGMRAGISAERPPPRFTHTHGHPLARLTHLSGSLADFDAMRWREDLTRLEADWLAPSVAALRSGRCRRLTLVAIGQGRAVSITATSRDLWRFWRRPAPVATLAS